METIDKGSDIHSAVQKLTLSPGLPEILQAPQLAEYMDYRKFLEDFYAFRREATKNDIRPYNYAMFSAAADIKSPNYLRMIIEGHRNLSPEMVGKFARALSLNKEQTEDFRLLVQYNQETDPAERSLLLRELSNYRVGLKIKTGEIDRRHFEKIPSWITWVLYTMIDQADVLFQPAQLRQLLRKKATLDEIQQALNSLIESGEVEQDEVTGNLKKSHNLIENADEVPVALVRKLQAQLMDLGMESLFQDPPTEREFGTLTLSLTQAEFEELKFKLRQMRKSVQKDNSVRRLTSKGERVYQMNLQLFPVSNRSD